jgi:hypothetical protein
MRPLTLVIAVLLSIAVVAGVGAARGDSGTLTGTVGTNDAFSISLLGPSGSPVRNLDPGTYTLLLHDRSSIHNFHLSGPGGVDVSTDIDAIGDKTFTVTLVNGTYFFQCDPHSGQMHGSFTVGPVTTTTTSTPPPPVVRKVSASVGPGARIAAKGTVGLKAGAVKVVVVDSSKIDNFHLKGPGISKATGVAFTGTVTWRLKLKAGRYTFRSDKHAALHGAFTVH